MPHSASFFFIIYSVSYLINVYPRLFYTLDDYIRHFIAFRVYTFHYISRKIPGYTFIKELQQSRRVNTVIRRNCLFIVPRCSIKYEENCIHIVNPSLAYRLRKTHRCVKILCACVLGGIDLSSKCIFFRL